MRFDPDSLSLADWESIEAVVQEPTDPAGAVWPEGTSLLVKLAAWAGWGLFLYEVGTRPADDE